MPYFSSQNPNMTRRSFLKNRRSFNTLFSVIILVFTTVSAANAAPSIEQWKQFNINTVTHYVLPNYDALETSANRLVAASQSLCSKPSKDTLTFSQNAFVATMATWQKIQNVRFGPVEISERHYSLQFWPDKKNHIGKRLARLIDSKDRQRLEESFASLPISIKGLPAIERLLFSDIPISINEDASFQCDVLVRISQEVHTVALALANEWHQQMLPQFSDATQLDGYFEDDIDAATTLLKAFVEPLEHIRDLKLDRPLGSDAAHAKGKRLESWRSQQSKQNIANNIASIKQFYTLAGTAGESSSLQQLVGNDAQEIDALFTNVEQALSLVPTPMKNTIETLEGYAAASELTAALTLLHEKLKGTLTAMGIHLGFNSRDGD